MKRETREGLIIAGSVIGGIAAAIVVHGETVLCIDFNFSLEFAGRRIKQKARELQPVVVSKWIEQKK